MKVAGVDLHDAAVVEGGHICSSCVATAPDGSSVFAKTRPGMPADFFTAEARGLDRLRVGGGPPVPRVRAVGPDGLVLEWIEPGAPTHAAAREFGHRLARLHASGSAGYGADTSGYIATIELDNSSASTWAEFYAVRRLRPALDRARERGAITDSEVAAVVAVIGSVAELGGPSEPPAQIHGDLWAGNLLWSAAGEVWLVDAAAAGGGHRETDLAMLALFGTPYLAEILAGYDEVTPLADGWQQRVALHQLHPVLIHAALFGGGYGARAAALARSLG